MINHEQQDHAEISYFVKIIFSELILMQYYDRSDRFIVQMYNL